MDEAKQDRADALILWGSLFAGPLVWAVEHETNFILVPWACAFGTQPTLEAISLIALLLVAAAAVAGWARLRRAGETSADTGPGLIPRVRLMAIIAIMLNGLFFLLILQHAMATFMLGACQ